MFATKGEQVRTSGSGRKNWTWTALIAAMTLIVTTACATVGGGQAEADSSESTGAPAVPSGPPELAKFYGQKLTWGPCTNDLGGGAQCTWLQVPLDYAAPAGETLRLRMLRLPARSSSAGKGVLFVNPGGPGGSAVEYAAGGDSSFSAGLRRAYDIVGFDPRGVGESNPITCVDPSQLDELLGADPTPDDATEWAHLRKVSADFGKACEAKYPKLLGHISTVDAAKDMDIARAAMGRPKLDYFGASYGTYLGATYAGLFPGNVGRLVLDGAVPPDITNEQLNLGQAEGFELATRAYVADCVSQPDCPLGRDVDSGMKRLQQFLSDIDRRPPPVVGDVRVTRLNEAWGSLALAQAMYDPGQWRLLTPALAEAMNGDGTDLFEFSLTYARRDASGRYDSNIMQVIMPVSCLDRGGAVLDDAERQRMTTEFVAKAPTWGLGMVNSGMTCETWPVKPAAPPAPIAAAGSPPILVVGTTRDPATPYRWAEQLARQLDNGVLLTRDGDGHTAYGRSNYCIDNAVDAFLLDGKVPADGTRC